MLHIQAWTISKCSLKTFFYSIKKIFSFMLYVGINLYSTVHYSEKYTCHAVVSITLTLFCIPVHLNKHNVTFIKLGTNDVNMMTSSRYCFPRYIVFGCFSYATRENIAFYDHSWNKFLSYTNIQQISSIYFARYTLFYDFCVHMITLN